MEILGAILGLFIWDKHWLTYVVALNFAIAGGILTFFISNRKNYHNIIDDVANKYIEIFS